MTYDQWSDGSEVRMETNVQTDRWTNTAKWGRGEQLLPGAAGKGAQNSLAKKFTTKNGTQKWVRESLLLDEPEVAYLNKL